LARAEAVATPRRAPGPHDAAARLLELAEHDAVRGRHLLEAPADILDLGQLRVRQHLEPLALHLRVQRVGHEVVEGPERLVAAHRQLRLAAERVQDAGHLHGDVARAHDQRGLGHLLEQEEAVRGDAVVDALEVRERRLAADGDEHVVRGVPCISAV